MERIAEWFYSVNEAVSAFVWGVPMLVLFLGAGIFFTVRTRGLQLRQLPDIVCAPFQPEGGQKGSISAFSAVSGALAGTLGIGNIVGVAGALLLGGPGIVFWMVASAFLCMILKYAETVLAMRYRTRNEQGETVGGPMYYMRDGLGLPGVAALFCALCIATSLFGAGNVTQIGTIAKAVQDTFDVGPLYVSAACAVLIALMTGGGVGRLGKVFAFLTPVMSVGFMAAALWVIGSHAERIPAVLACIVREALHPAAAAGGVGAYALLRAAQYGVSRGVFSNEAGMGSSPIIHAASENSPARQGMCGAFEVFFDTVVMAGLTALAILVSGVPLDGQGDAAALCTAAFATVFGAHAGPLLTGMLVVFAVSSVPCWYYYGARCVEYLFKGPRAKAVYRCVFLMLTVVCPLLRLDGMWQLADSLNGLMAVPNLICIIMLSKEVADVSEAWYARKGLGALRGRTR